MIHLTESLPIHMGQATSKMLRIDPHDIPALGSGATYLNQAGRFHEAREMATRAIEQQGSYFFGYFALAESCVGANDFETAASWAPEACGHAPWHERSTGLLAGILARRGDHVRSQELVQQMEGRLAHGLAIGMFLYYLTAGNDEAAIRHFATAVERRDPTCLIYVQGAFTQRLRGNGAWEEILRMMNLV